MPPADDPTAVISMYLQSRFVPAAALPDISVLDSNKVAAAMMMLLVRVFMLFTLCKLV